jgi:hypothetical protein
MLETTKAYAKRKPLKLMARLEGFAPSERELRLRWKNQADLGYLNPTNSRARPITSGSIHTATVEFPS